MSTDRAESLLENEDGLTLKSDRGKPEREPEAYCILSDQNGVRMVNIKPDVGEMSFGRSTQATETVLGESVSREHLILHWSGGRLFLRDNQSTNGVELNGVAIEPATDLPLSSGDEITFGDAAIVVGITAPTSGWERRVLSYSELWARLSQEFERSRRHRRPLGFAMIRIEGDANGAIDFLLDQLDALDVLAEYGRGEFALLLPEAEPSEARVQVEKYLTELQGLTGVIASGGMTHLPGGASGPDKLLEEARSALGSALDSDRRLEVHSAEAAGMAMRETTDGASAVVLAPAMKKLFAVVDKVAPTDITVLITGETGAGKGVLAEAVHLTSKRADRALMCINCASIPETLLESELFGYEAGAFTGANRKKKGLFEAASGGTLFLDEVGELTIAIQAKLLRVLEDKKLVRLGSTREVSVDVRVIAATNQDVERAVAAGKFRKDLLFRLNGFSLEVPPLRERREEILPLAKRFAAQFAAGLDRAVPRFAKGTAMALVAYAWPGNIRELRNVVERAVILADGNTLDVEHLPDGVAGGSPHHVEASDVSGPISLDGSMAGRRRAKGGVKQRLDQLEHDAIEEALRACGGNRTRAAERLGISRRSLLYKIKKHGIK